MNQSQQLQPSQAMGQTPFFYYNPDLSDQRQHGHFSPDPNTIALSNQIRRFQPQMYTHEMTMQSQFVPLQPRPAPLGSQSFTHPQMPFPLQPFSTPMVSPRPVYQKPTYILPSEGQSLSLDTECANSDFYVYPATPPLSVSGSSLSSPPMSSSLLPTPGNNVFLPLENLEGVKEGCEGEVHSEILAGADWTRCGSPPLTPGMSLNFI